MTAQHSDPLMPTEGLAPCPFGCGVAPELSKRDEKDQQLWVFHFSDGCPAFGWSTVESWNHRVYPSFGGVGVPEGESAYDLPVVEASEELKALRREHQDHILIESLLVDEVKILRGLLSSMLSKVNRVTSRHRHGQPTLKNDLDELSNRQIEIEEKITKASIPAGTRAKLAAQPRVTEPRIYTAADIHEAPEGDYRLGWSSPNAPFWCSDSERMSKTKIIELGIHKNQNVQYWGPIPQPPILPPQEKAT